MVCDPSLVLPAVSKQVSHCWTPRWNCIRVLGSASHFLCFLAESPSLAEVSRAQSICPCVPLSFSPGLCPCLRPSPAKLALCSTLGLLPSSPPRCSVRSWGFQFFSPSFPFPSPQSSRVLVSTACPALGAEFCRCGGHRAGGAAKGGGTEGQEQGWLPPLPQH